MRISDWSSDVCASDLTNGGSTSSSTVRMALVVSRRIAPLFLNPAARPVCLPTRDSEPPMNDKNDEARDSRWLLLLALFWLAAATWPVSQKWAAIKGLALPDNADNPHLQQVRECLGDT